MDFPAFPSLRLKLPLYQSCGWFAIALGLIVLLGWVIGSPALTMLLPGSANTMKVNTAFCFVLSGWVLVSANARSRWQRRLRLSCLGIVVVIASLTLLQHVTGWNLGIDELLIRDRISPLGSGWPGRMSDQASISFLLLAASLNCSRSWREPRLICSQGLALVAAWIALLGLFGYLLSIDTFYLFLDRSTAIAANTVVGLLVLSIGALSLHPQKGLLAVLSSPSLGGRLSRVLLPWFLLLPIVLRGIKILSQKYWSVTPVVGDGLVALTTTSLLLALLWLSARSLNQQEEKLLVALQSAQEIERRFRQIVMQAPLPMVLHRNDGLILEVNDAWVELSGYRLEEAPTVASWVEAAYGTEAVPGVLQGIQAQYELAPGQRMSNGEFVLRTKSGTLRTWDFYSSALGTDEEGRILVLSMAIDITDRTLADRQLRNLSENLEHLVQIRTTELESIRDQLETAQRVAKVGSWAFEIATQTIQWSPQLFRLFGMDPCEPEPSFEEHQQQIDSRDRSYWLESVQRCIQEGIPYSIDFRVLWRDGSIHWVSGQGEAVRDANGQIVRLIGTAIDITDRKATELRLAEAEAQARLLIEKNPGVVYRFYPSLPDDKGYISPQIEDLIGVPPSQWDAGLARTWQDFLHPGDRDWVVSQFQAAVTEQRAYSFEYRMIRTNGQTIWVRDQGEILFEPDGTLAIQGLAVDITALKETGLALQQRLQELNQRNREMQLLGQFSDFLQACSSMAEAGQVIASFMPQLFPDCRGQLSLLQKEANLETLQAVVTWGQPTHTQSSFLLSDCWALRRGMAYLYHPGQVPGPACHHVQGAIAPDESIFCLPLSAFGEILGHLQFERLVTDTSSPGDSTARPLAETVAEQLALAIANLQLRETLRQENLRDPLTGLFNRRYLQEFFEQELSRAKRNGDNIGILLLDIDHFKRFNDEFGHDAGDVVLKQVSRALLNQVRASDVVCRFGGEEIAILMPGANIEVSARKADQIRQAIAELVIDYRDQTLPPLTVSIGVTAFPDSGITGDALLKAADTSLYQAKAAGRNCVVVSQPNWRKLEEGAIEKSSPIATTLDSSGSSS
ncbi:sensor domain-containing diguanylate cyclase [Synechococcus elongatus]|uniref:Diguanylate cyclase n=1 Tax=Synechococcus elongatus PCC 11802 TaxID=2283154 RepID=A0AAT9JXY3_SYNEL|nr:sensor domain-containing diguanylate cyclase [Synechococcus elongatus]